MKRVPVQAGVLKPKQVRQARNYPRLQVIYFATVQAYAAQAILYPYVSVRRMHLERAPPRFQYVRM